MDFSCFMQSTQLKSSYMIWSLGNATFTSSVLIRMKTFAFLHQLLRRIAISTSWPDGPLSDIYKGIFQRSPRSNSAASLPSQTLHSLATSMPQEFISSCATMEPTRALRGREKTLDVHSKITLAAPFKQSENQRVIWL